MAVKALVSCGQGSCFEPHSSLNLLLVLCTPSNNRLHGGNTGEVKAARNGVGNHTSEMLMVTIRVLFNRHSPYVQQ